MKNILFSVLLFSCGKHEEDTNPVTSPYWVTDGVLHVRGDMFFAIGERLVNMSDANFIQATK
ncbi:MAG TPA: hypothetical protein PLD12_05620 [Bacteroidales bacterium]|nr:hypothetical protein [Bacteroidales bacterium]HOK98598.1 hypothetical protein [Bacteroidales bacterium]HPO66349.1 hypothetical protein [Bacteroidales bacterium]